MGTIKKLMFICFSISLLAACGHREIHEDFVFDDTKDYALISYDIYFIGETWPNYALYLVEYDPETGTINPDNRVEAGSGFWGHRDNEEVEFYIGTSKPGTFVIGYVRYQTEGRRSLLCFSEKTLMFDIEPGRVYYLGEFLFSMDHPPDVNLVELDALSHGRAHARGRMREYSNITADVVVPEHNYVSYDRGEVERPDACIKDFVF